MSQKSGTPKMSSEQIVKDIRRATRKQYSAEEKIRIVLDGLRGEHSIAELCRADVYFGRNKPSCWNEKGSNEPQSKITACNTN